MIIYTFGLAYDSPFSCFTTCSRWISIIHILALGMSRIDGYSYTKRFLPCNESESDFRIFEKKNCPTHLKTEKSNVSSRRNFPFGLRTGYSVKRVLDLPLKAYRYTATDVGYASRYCRRLDAKANFCVLNSNQEVAKGV